MPVPTTKATVKDEVREKMIKKYFAIMRQWYSPTDAKNMAKTKFNLASFDDISKEQIGMLLAQIEEQQ